MLILGTSCFGYIRETTSDSSPVPVFRTDNTGIQFLLNSGVVPGAQSSASGSAVTVISTGSDPLAATRAALASWNGVTTANIKFLPLQSTNTAISNDGQMVIAIGSTASDVSAVGNALAITAYFYNPVDQTVNGVNLAKGALLDTDVILNPAISFSTDGSTQTDLQSVLTHELGHSLGANHTGMLGASMFQFNTGLRFLSSDDLAFINVAYPLPVNPVPSGTISGTVTANGSGVPYALLTAFDTTAGVTTGGVTNPDGTYSFQVPPGNYQIYAEPMNGVQNINIYLTSTQLAAAQSVKFQTTIYGGTLSVAANGTATANIAVTPGAATLATPLAAVSAVGGYARQLYTGAPLTIPSGQSVDLNFYGAGFDSTLSTGNFTVYGKGISVHPGSAKVDKTSTANGFSLFRVTLDVTAATAQSLASLVITSGANTISYSGALVIVPPTPTFVPAGVISAAPYTGIQGGVSPGGIYTIYDIPNAPNLGPATYVQNGPYDAYGNLPTILAGVSVTFDGVQAPMFLAWGNQLNLQVPFEVAGKTSTNVIVSYLGSASAPVSVPVLAVQPEFFTSDGTAVRAYNLPSYTINSAQSPAPKGSYVEVYGTGVGKVSYAIATGHGVPSFPSGYTGNYTYSVGGSAAGSALFGGWTPTAVGLAQWDLQIPSTGPSGAVSIVVTDPSGVASRTGTTIFVQ